MFNFGCQLTGMVLCVVWTLNKTKKVLFKEKNLGLESTQYILTNLNMAFETKQFFFQIGNFLSKCLGIHVYGKSKFQTIDTQKCKIANYFSWYYTYFINCTFCVFFLKLSHAIFLNNEVNIMSILANLAIVKYETSSKFLISTKTIETKHIIHLKPISISESANLGKSNCDWLWGCCN